MRREMHLQHQSLSREESHQARVLSKGQVQRDHNREDLQNRVRVLLDRGQSQGRDPSKVRDHQVRGPNQARVPLAKDRLGRPPGKVRDHQPKDPRDNRLQNQVRDHQVKAPNRVALPSKKVDPLNKDLGSLDSKDHQALGLVLESQLRMEGLQVSRGLENLQEDSVHCVRPPS